jgi:hypothetical protein
VNNILFYTSNSKNFRSTLLGYLFDLQKCDNIQIILLVENFNNDLNLFLSDKSIFPKIIRIIYVGQYDNGTLFNFLHFKKLHRIVKDAIRDFNPILLIVSSDFHSIFELLICRFAKLNKTKIISIACSNTISDMKTTAEWIRMYTLDVRYKFIPKFISKIIFNSKTWFNHFIVYNLSPLSIGITPFYGYSSYLLMRGQSGMRDADFQLVYSNQEKINFIKSGVNKNIIYNIKHPYFNINEKYPLNNFFNDSKLNIDFLIIHPAELVGYNNSDFSLISQTTRIKINLELLSIINNLFPKSNIYIKLHPDVSKNIYDLLYCEYLRISKNIIFIDPKSPIESYFFNTKVIIDFPRSGSTSIFLSTVFKPNILKISADVFQEFWGDNYKNNKSVKYTNSLNDFKNVLTSYKNREIFSDWNYNMETFDHINILDFLKNKTLI